MRRLIKRFFNCFRFYVRQCGFINTLKHEIPITIEMVKTVYDVKRCSFIDFIEQWEENEEYYIN